MLTLTLSVHLLCMNLATAGPLVYVWLDWCERRGDQLAGLAGRRLAGWSVGALLAGMAIGVAMAWWEWTPDFWRALVERFSSRLYWGAWELAFSVLLLAIVWGWWRKSPGQTGARVGRSLLAILAATNLMYHFPPLFVLVGKLASGELASTTDAHDVPFTRLMWQGEVLALTVHFWLASLAVAGVALAVAAVRLAAHDSTQAPAAANLAVWGGRLALVPTLLQIPVGLWVMMQLPPLRQSQLMGRDVPGSVLLAGGVLGALWLLHVLIGMAVGEANRKAVRRSLVLLIVVVVLMTGALRRSRLPHSPAPPTSVAAPAVHEALHHAA